MAAAGIKTNIALNAQLAGAMQQAGLQMGTTAAEQAGASNHSSLSVLNMSRKANAELLQRSFKTKLQQVESTNPFVGS